MKIDNTTTYKERATETAFERNANDFVNPDHGDQSAGLAACDGGDLPGLAALLRAGESGCLCACFELLRYQEQVW